jgi:gamma-glutamyl-gamma-aminobutyrate hydrolase PuuD
MQPRPRPIVLLTADAIDEGKPEYRLRSNYAEAIVEAGGAPLIIPHEIETLEAALKAADGVVMSGTAPGASLDERRRAFEEQLVSQALARDLPLLGICHGMQVLGEALGGTIARDLPGMDAEAAPHIPYPVADRLAHPVAIEAGSRLAAWNDGATAEVSSLHRHALVGEGEFRIAARAPDGVLEAIEGLGRRFCLGVQWHPEYRLTALDRRILAEFVRHCAARA